MKHISQSQPQQTFENFRKGLTITTGNTNAPTIMIGEKATDLIKASRTQQTLMTKYNVKNPAHLFYLGIGDRDW